MLSGVGSLILGDVGFSANLVSLCTSSFDLSFKYETYGYKYLNSQNKMMMPAIENYDAKKKSWTIDLDFSTLNQFVRGYFGSEKSTNISNYYSLSFFGGQSPVTVPASLGVVTEYVLFNQTTNQVMTLAMSPSNANHYSVSGGSISTHSSAAAHLICLLALGSEPSYDISYISNKIFSYSGLMYSVDSSIVHAVYCPKVQLSAYPELTADTSERVSFEVLDEIKVFKI
jgi:hypothetical protein